MYKKLLASVLASVSSISLASAQVIGGGGGGTASNGLNTLGYTAWAQYGIKCDGATTATDDSAAFAAMALATGQYNFVGPTNATCIVGNLTITDHQTLDCNGAILKPPAGANWVVKKTGTGSAIKRCVIFDPSLNLQKTANVTGVVAPGATVIPVDDGTRAQVGMIATVKLASGIWWPSKVTATSALSITIADPIPATITGVVVSAGGTGYVDGREVIFPAVNPSGAGVPATGHVTVVAGAITAVVVDSPGLFTTTPNATAVPFDPTVPTANSAVFTMTYSGVSNGSQIDTAFGSVIDDNANGGTVQDIIIAEAPVGFQIANTGGQSFNTTGEEIRRIDMNAISMVGFAKMVNVNNIGVQSVRMYGVAHHASAFGTAGLYIDGDNPTIASGGSKYDILALGFETGIFDQHGSLDIFTNAVSDTIRNYAMICFSCTDTDFSDLTATFTGPNALTGTANQGLGAVFSGTAINNSIGKLTTANNASDVHFGDNTSAVWIGNLAWSWTKALTGWTSSLQPGYTLFSIPTTSSAAGIGPVFLSPNTLSATEGASVILGLRGLATSFFITSSVNPGAATYTVALRVNRWSGTAYLGWNTVGTCTMTGTVPVCLWSGPGVYLLPQDQVDLEVSNSAGNFPANQTFSAYATGM